MDIYLVFGFISEDGSDEGHTYIYGVFDDWIYAVCIWRTERILPSMA